MSFKHFVLSGSLLVSLPFVSACDDPLALDPSAAVNFVDSITVYALRGTPTAQPSGYDLVSATLARTDRSVDFDFAFELQDGEARILPAGVLGLGFNAGWQRSNQAFDDIAIAPLDDYILDEQLVVNVGSVFLVRSRPSLGTGVPETGLCPSFFIAVPRYGKFEVVAIDSAARTITFRALVNINCGYRGLRPGFPER